MPAEPPPLEELDVPDVDPGSASTAARDRTPEAAPPVGPDEDVDGATRPTR